MDQSSSSTTVHQLVDGVEDDKQLPSHGIYWSEQNDDILLQNLFANTLLSDEFSKKTDFDLSFDNLQLNLDHDDSTTTSNGAVVNQDGDKRNSGPDESILMLNQPLLEPIETPTAANSVTDVTSDLEKQILADTLSMTLNLNKPVSNKDLEIVEQTADAKLFKKPEFITLTNLNSFDSSDFVINLNSSLDSATTSSATDRATAKKSIALLQSKLKESASSANNKLKKIRKRSKLVNSATGSNSASSTSQDTANCSTSGKKDLKLVKLKQSRLASNGSSSTSTPAVAASIKPEKHANKVARSKLDGKASKNGVEPLTKKFAGSFVNSQLSLTSPTSSDSTFSISTNGNNISGFGFSSSATNDLSNDKNIIILKSLKKDEVDLHIKELSLLDLHSSEDDSTSDLSNKNRANSIKMRASIPRPPTRPLGASRPNISSHTNNQSSSGGTGSQTSATIISNSSSFLSSSSSSTSSLATNLINSSNEPMGSLTSLGNNELISKRIKYSPVSSQSMISSSHLVNVPEAVTPMSGEVDAASKYLSKSLDSDVVISAASTSGIMNDNSGLLSPLSPPSMACKKKRKKKDNGVLPEKQTEIDQKPVTANQSITLVNLTQYPVNNTTAAHQFQSTNLFQTGVVKTQVAIENDTLQHMKNLDLNNDLTASSKTSPSTSNGVGSSEASKLTSNLTVNLDLNDINSRNYLWNLLKAHSTQDELIYQFGSVLHDKITFWDLAQLKLKYAKSNQLKTTYQIIDDYTVLYSNMRTYMEKVVNEQSSSSNSSSIIAPGAMSNSSRKSDNSSRSRSSSRNPRKQSTSSVNR